MSSVSNLTGKGYRKSLLQVEDLYALRHNPRAINPHEFGSVSWFKFQDSLIHKMAKEVIILRQRLMLMEAGFTPKEGKAQINFPTNHPKAMSKEE